MIPCAQFRPFGPAEGGSGNGGDSVFSEVAADSIVQRSGAFFTPPPYNPKVPSDDTPDSSATVLPRRVLGLDVGSRTIGIAVSDPLAITAQGLQTIRRKNKRLDFQALEDLIRQYDVAEIVVGYPLRMSGLAGTQSEKMTLFAQELAKRFALPVHLWDERLTTAEANRVLRDSEMSIKRRGEVVDRLAAVLILQSWLDHRSQKKTSTTEG
jgi:putative holliday junction resolvase